MFEPDINMHDIAIAEDGKPHIIDSYHNRILFRYESDEMEAVIKLVKMARSMKDDRYDDEIERIFKVPFYEPVWIKHIKIKYLANFIKSKEIEDVKGYSTRFEEILKLNIDEKGIEHDYPIKRKALRNAELLIDATETTKLNAFLKAEDINLSKSYNPFVWMHSYSPWNGNIDITYRNNYKFVKICAKKDEYSCATSFDISEDSCSYKCYYKKVPIDKIIEVVDIIMLL